jgi:hypothetical protein
MAGAHCDLKLQEKRINPQLQEIVVTTSVVSSQYCDAPALHKNPVLPKKPGWKRRKLISH